MNNVRRLRLDSGNTRVTFDVRWFGVLRVSGWFPEVEGELVIGDEGGLASLVVRLRAGSVNTGIGLRDRHLRGPRFLDGGAHPVIEFRSSSVSRLGATWRVEGVLTLRGQARNLVLTVPDETGPEARRFSATFTVPRREHGIGAAHGLRRLNPLLWAIAADVAIRAEVVVPATLLQRKPASARAH